MKKTLILVTANYPYNRGDSAFIQDEMTVLSRYFDEVIVMPQDRGLEVLSLPPRVRFDDELCRALFDTRKNRGVSVIKYASALFSSYTWREILANPGCVMNPKNLARLIYWVYKARVVEKILERCLQNRRNESVTLYSFWFTSVAFAMAQVGARYPNVRSITRAHGAVLYYERQSGGYFPLRRMTLAKIDAVALVTDYTREYLSRHEKEYAYKFFSFPLGTEDYRGKFSRGSGVSHKAKPLIVSCSSVSAIKRVDRIVESLSFLESKFEQGLEWVHFGDGPDLEKVKGAASRELKRTDFVFCGHTPKEEILRFYSSGAIDCFVTMTESEGGRPVSIMEALCFGIPIVAPTVGGIPEIVDDTVGRLVPKDVDAAKMADALFSILTTGHSTEISGASRQRWEDRCMAEQNYKLFANFLLSMHKE